MRIVTENYKNSALSLKKYKLYAKHQTERGASSRSILFWFWELEEFLFLAGEAYNNPELALYIGSGT